MDRRRRPTSLKPWKSPSTFPAAVFPLLQEREAVAGGGRHFGEHVYRTPAKPQEVPAPGDEEWEEEEADVAKAVNSSPLPLANKSQSTAALLCLAMWDAGEPGVFSLCCFISEQLSK